MTVRPSAGPCTFQGFILLWIMKDNFTRILKSTKGMPSGCDGTKLSKAILKTAGETDERVLNLKCLDEISPGIANSDEDLLSNCSTESAGSSSTADRKKNVAFTARKGCPQCSNFVNHGCPKCSPSARRNLQKRLLQSPAIGVALTDESSQASAPQPTEPCAQSPSIGSKGSIARLKCLKESKTYRPELWEVVRAVCTQQPPYTHMLPVLTPTDIALSLTDRQTDRQLALLTTQ
jgi:hypothetical protein